MIFRLNYLFAGVFAVMMSTGCSSHYDQSEDIDRIKTILQEQQEAWNRGDVDAFMIAYWASDSLRFYNAAGMTYGWQNTLDNYKLRYPDKAAMGRLTFGIESIDRLGQNGFVLMGTYHLDRETDQLDGYFTLIWKRIEGEWKIISDMTCGNNE